MKGVKKPHKHAEVIKAWADGAEIQVKFSDNAGWEDVAEGMSWSEGYGYRVKPVREFPKSGLAYQTLCDIWNDAHKVKSVEGTGIIALQMCADAAVKQYILDCEAAEAHAF